MPWEQGAAEGTHGRAGEEEKVGEGGLASGPVQRRNYTHNPKDVFFVSLHIFLCLSGTARTTKKTKTPSLARARSRLSHLCPLVLDEDLLVVELAVAVEAPRLLLFVLLLLATHVSVQSALRWLKWICSVARLTCVKQSAHECLYSHLPRRIFHTLRSKKIKRFYIEDECLSSLIHCFTHVLAVLARDKYASLFTCGRFSGPRLACAARSRGACWRRFVVFHDDVAGGQPRDNQNKETPFVFSRTLLGWTR